MLASGLHPARGEGAARKKLLGIKIDLELYQPHEAAKHLMLFKQFRCVIVSAVIPSNQFDKVVGGEKQMLLLLEKRNRCSTMNTACENCEKTGHFKYIHLGAINLLLHVLSTSRQTSSPF